MAGTLNGACQPTAAWCIRSRTYIKTVVSVTTHLMLPVWSTSEIVKPAEYVSVSLASC